MYPFLPHITDFPHIFLVENYFPHVMNFPIWQSAMWTNFSTWQIFQRYGKIWSKKKSNKQSKKLSKKYSTFWCQQVYKCFAFALLLLFAEHKQTPFVQNCNPHFAQFQVWTRFSSSREWGVVDVSIYQIKQGWKTGVNKKLISK